MWWYIFLAVYLISLIVDIIYIYKDWKRLSWLESDKYKTISDFVNDNEDVLIMTIIPFVNVALFIAIIITLIGKIKIK